MSTDALEILKKRRGSDPARELTVGLRSLCARVAEAIVEAREAAGLTQEQLAKKIGSSQSAVARIEDADYDGHSLRTLAKIALSLNLTIAISFQPRSTCPIGVEVQSCTENRWKPIIQALSERDACLEILKEVSCSYATKVRTKTYAIETTKTGAFYTSGSDRHRRLWGWTDEDKERVESGHLV